MKGTNEELGRAILAEVGVPLFESAEEAAKKAVELARLAGERDGHCGQSIDS